MKKEANAPLKTTFSSILLKWNREKNKRQMPWKGEKDPYRIWLSEIILQQTRVEQGLNYYNRFITTFPDIHALANAKDEKVFKLWEGLGYYTRCRNLIATARYISTGQKGKFPSTYDTIKALKGIGPYTAAAISSFAFNLPHAVVDGNVFRVLARIFGISTPVDSTEGKKQFTALADELLDKKQPGLYNQAIMDFGAIICKPANPLCGDCVFNKHCYAFLQKKIPAFPVKEKVTKVRKRWFYYLVIEHKNKIAIRQRSEKDIWQGLFEFPMMENASPAIARELLPAIIKEAGIAKTTYTLDAISPMLKQQLSHQTIGAQFIGITIKQKLVTTNDWTWIKKEELEDYPFPQVINQFLKDKNRSQSLF